MSCERYEEILDAWLQGEASEAQLAHLRSCERCERKHRETQATLSLLERAGEGAPDLAAFETRLWARVAKEPAAPPVAKVIRPPFWQRPAVVALAAAAALALVWGLSGDAPPEPDSGVAPKVAERAPEAPAAPSALAQAPQVAPRPKAPAPEAPRLDTAMAAHSAAESQVVLLEVAANQVHAMGAAPAGPAGVSDAKDRAIEDALRRAVEQVADTLVAFEMDVDDFAAKMEAIERQPRRFVESWEIQDETFDRSGYRVRLNARVSEVKLEQEMVRAGIILARLGRPRLLTLFEDSLLGKAESTGCEQIIVDTLRTYGFAFAHAAEGKPSVRDAGTAQALRSLGRATAADVIVKGRCEVSDRGSIASTAFHEVHAGISVQVFDAETGRVLTVASRDDGISALVSGQSARRAIEATSTTLAHSLAGRLLVQWQRKVLGARSFRLEVRSGASHPRMLALEALLREKSPEVQSVSVRRASYRDGQAQLLIGAVGHLDRIADLLATAALEAEGSAFRVEVLGFGSEVLEIELD